MRNAILLFVISCLTAALPASAQSDSFVVDGVYRNYIVHLPTGYTSSAAYPLVLNLHGYTSNAVQEELYTQMDISADANHYIVVYPNGISNYWNAFGVGADDVKFIRQLIDTISVRHHINTKRVYSCGMSNGGYMSYTLACQLSDKIAAIASVAGTMSLNTYTTCNPGRKVPVMHIHGTTDPTVPYATGAGNSVGVEQTLAYWRDTNNCGMLSDTIDLANTNTGDSCTVKRIDYAHCSNSELLFYKVKNGGHTWPGSPISINLYGYTDRDISATDEIWKFFSKYSLDGPLSIDETINEKTMRIYPNPIKEIFEIESEKEINRIDLFDLSGRKLASFASPKNINISFLSSGIYELQISQNAGEQIISRIVKN